MQIREILSKKGSHVKKLTYVDWLNQAASGYPTKKPTIAHKSEWKEEKKWEEGGMKSMQHVEAWWI